MRHACKGLLLLALLIPLLVNAQDINQDLIDAAERGDTATVKALLTNDEIVNARDEEGWTALMVASGGGHIAIVQALLEAGADVNAKKNNGWTALMVAAYGGQTDVVKVLLEAGDQTVFLYHYQ